MAPVVPNQNHGLLTFLAPFLGAFAAVGAVALIGVGGYFGVRAWDHSGSSAKSKDLLADVASWQQGKDAAVTLTNDDKPDIGWWTRTFDLPKEQAVVDYLKQQGLTVSRLEPAHFASTKDDTTVTYDVYAEVPEQLLRLQKAAWSPADPDLQRFHSVLVLNRGMLAGQQWDTEHPAIAAEAGTKLNFAWKVHWDKAYNIVETDRLPLNDGVFTPEQVKQFQAEAANTEMALRGQIQLIDERVQEETQAKLARVPADPPKPALVSTHWNHGDGSGEPTKSAERIGGGTLAGAAGGAAFGAAAGDAGMGAGIGAGVGLLGGFIYDTVSKNNDRHRYERAAAAENEERLDAWHDQLRALKKQRSDIEQQGLAERDHALDDLTTRIQANDGKPDAIAPAVATAQPETVTDAPPVDAVPAIEPTAAQPTGPLLAKPSALVSSPANDAALGQKLVGYWTSGRHAYHFSADGTCHTIGGSSRYKWTIRNGAFVTTRSGDEPEQNQIVTLTDTQFVYRDADDTTFTLHRITQDEAENY